MAKTYPVIDNKRTIRVNRIVNNVSQPPVDFPVSRFYQNTRGTTTPGFPEVLRENSFWSQITRENWQPGWFRQYNSSGKVTQNIVTATCPIKEPTRQELTLVKERAIKDFYNWIPQATANLALLYAERRKTGESILLALNGILKCVRDVRRGKVPELLMGASELRGRQKFSGAWLNYIYGIQPFVQDLYAISGSRLTDVWWGTGESKYDQEWFSEYYHGMGRYKVKCKFGLSLDNPIVASLAQGGLTNPALIAWEVTPFSFMLDWLYPVGPYLEQLSITQGFTKHSGSMTICYKYSGYAWDPYNKTSARHNVHHRKIERITMAFPDPPVPRFKNPFSPIHALNALSIIHQLVSDDKTPRKRLQRTAK